MSTITDWMQFYQDQFIPIQIETPPSAAAPTTATTTTTITTSRNTNFVPDQGRISKPIKRRSRASRRTPTTLLTTDISNFRAMVQHFTGGPAARSQLHTGDAPFSVGFGAQPALGGSAGAAAAGFYHYEALRQQHELSASASRQGGHDQSGGVSSNAPAAGTASQNRDGNRDYGNYML